MPIYEFQCTDCGEKKEILFKNSDEKIEMKCNKCGSENLQRVLSSTNFAVSGGGSGVWIACVLVFGGSLGTVLFGPSLLARLSPPSVVVEGIEETPSTDGRLLGHFPYPEASVTELVSVEPGIELHTDAASAFRALQQAAAADP